MPTRTLDPYACSAFLACRGSLQAPDVRRAPRAVVHEKLPSPQTRLNAVTGSNTIYPSRIYNHSATEDFRLTLERLDTELAPGNGQGEQRC